MWILMFLSIYSLSSVIYNFLIEKRQDLKILYCTSVSFLNVVKSNDWGKLAPGRRLSRSPVRQYNTILLLCQNHIPAPRLALQYAPKCGSRDSGPTPPKMMFLPAGKGRGNTTQLTTYLDTDGDYHNNQHTQTHNNNNRHTTHNNTIYYYSTPFVHNQGVPIS